MRNLMMGMMMLVGFVGSAYANDAVVEQPPQASGDLQQCEADCDALYVPGGATHGACIEECNVFLNDGTRASTEQPTMLAEGGCYVNDQGEEVCYGEDGSVLGSAATKADTMLAGLSDCKFDCDEYEDGSQSCYDTCDKFFPQASIDAGQPTMLAGSQ
ncbi:hypothetical protein, partial [Thioalkalivibrio sp. HK1]|uniref:hypothetical protein n=1 Tax=Thioalkalivibrio sp. HK1 TaxID=1469245 RepID=UPI0012DD831C